MRTRKHVVDIATTQITSSAKQGFTLMLGAINPIPYTNPTNVGVDSHVFGMSLMLEVSPGTSVANANGHMQIDWFVAFNIAGNQTFPDPGNTGTSVINNQIFHEDQAMFVIPTASTANPSTFQPAKWNVNVRIPKAWTRFGQNDQILFQIKCDTADQYLFKLKLIFTEFLP